MTRVFVIVCSELLGLEVRGALEKLAGLGLDLDHVHDLALPVVAEPLADEGEPGPADYNLRDAVKMSGGHFSKAHVKSELELLQ